MIIHSMTATFGKLRHETLELKPGMNLLQAPNEWGKSTWCAFLIAMLYGIETRQRTTTTALADKQRYDPWSGELMSGRMELTWNDRRITIERSTRGRIPMGEFRAYETDSGLEVPELTAANCGQQLLSVERDVFTRAGFIRLQDLPVTQNDALRRRLNNLVTTGDESGAGDALGKQLKDLKNKCRHNRTGLLPEAEAEKQRLTEQLIRQQQIQEQIRKLTERQAQLEQQQKLLENHADALRYQAAQQGAQAVKNAQNALEQAQQELRQQQELCDTLPDIQQAEAARQKGLALQQQVQQQEVRRQQLPQKPVQPEVPVPFAGCTPEQALERARADTVAVKLLEQEKKKQAKLPVIYGIAAAALLLLCVILQSLLQISFPLIAVGGGVVAVAAVVLLAVMASRAKGRQRKIEEVYAKYPGISPDGWLSLAQQYQQAQTRYLLEQEQYSLAHTEQDRQQALLQQEVSAFAADGTLLEKMAYWEVVLQHHQQLSALTRKLLNAQEHAQAIQSVATDAPAPQFQDELTYSAQETERMLAQTNFEMRQTHIDLGQCMGQAESFEPEEALDAQVEAVNRRIGRLEDYYRALELALEQLHQATTTLQRRFAPRISSKAQEYFKLLTGGRYQRITMESDLSLRTSAQDENETLPPQWRSDGTVDQLYLALRLAVAEELTPDAPLVLDDALVRFDDTRLQAALALLRQAAQQKQILLFTCQSREKNLIEKENIQ